VGLLTDLVRAVVLLSGFADFALQATPYLSTDTDSVAELDSCHQRASFYDCSNYFVADAERKIFDFSPTSSESMDIGSAHTTGFDFNIYIERIKFLGFKLEIILDTI
jgi:hypothetical protein